MIKLTLPVESRDHLQGSRAAPVTLLEYGDYECPHCGAAHGVVKKLQETMGEDLCFCFRNFPLTTIHPHAERAAEAAEAAGAQDKFWEMHDLLLEHQSDLAEPDLREYARDLGLDILKFRKDLEGRVFLPRVKEDILTGIRSGVNGTPTFFINGVRYDGAPDYDELLSALEAAAG